MLRVRSISAALKIAAIGLGVGMLHRYVGSYISLETIQRYQQELQAMVLAYGIIGYGGYVLFYVVLTSLSLPFLGLLTLLAGFLFPFWIAMGLVLIGFFCHCFLNLTLVRAYAMPFVRRQFGAPVAALEKKMNQHGLAMVVFLRVCLLAPSFLVNCAGAFTTLNAWLFSLVSLIASVPILTVLVYSGRRLGEISTIKDIFSVEMTSGLVGLALCAGAGFLVSVWRSQQTTPDSTVD